MLIIWKIRYLNRTTREFDDRLLYLNTDLLDPVTKAAVELSIEAKSQDERRKFLKFRHLFKEESDETLSEWFKTTIEFTHPPIDEYFEDENCDELSRDEMARILTGNTNAIDVTNLEPHDIEFKLSAPIPIPVAAVNLSEADVKLLGFFRRDLSELLGCAFVKDGPGTIGWKGDSEPVLKTAVTDEEVRSCVTVFRRLYMHDERANFQKAVGVFIKAVGDNPYGKWIRGSTKSYNKAFDKTPWFPPVRSERFTVTRRQLIDVFIYSQYAHQPNDERLLEYSDYLVQVNGKKGVLTWLFLRELHHCIRQMACIGKPITAWFGRYCEHHQVKPNVLNSLSTEHPGIGSQEKEEVRKLRLFEDQAIKLADDLWSAAGRPSGGSSQYLASARQHLRNALEG